MAQAKLLHRALLQLGVAQPVVVGHSWGSMVAIALALQQPEYVRGLLLLSGYYYPTARLDAVMFSPPALPVIGDLLSYTVAPVLGRLMWPALVRKLFAPAETPARFRIEYPVWMGLRPSQVRASAEEAALMSPSAARLAKRYRELAMPVTIMAGAGDLQVLPELHSERLHRELPQSELIVVPGVGHMIQHSAPEKVMAAIERLGGTAAWRESGRDNVAVFSDSRRHQVH
jgi:pimeloyl-ACP methyl ester carboxylesterase